MTVTCMLPWPQAFLQGEGQGEAVGQLVRGGLYEADMLRRRMRCVYWPEHAHRLSRGTWFVEKAPDWVPLKVRCLPRLARCEPSRFREIHERL